MGKMRLLLLMKPIECNPFGQSKIFQNSKIIQFLENRQKVHQNAVRFCQDVLRKKNVDWRAIPRSDLMKPIHNFDLVVTVGGDGTLLQASHFVDDSVPVLGVNSDPTQIDQLEEFESDFDATRSTGYLCAATVSNFEQMIDSIITGEITASRLARISIRVNSEALPSYALNDVLIADPCPAKVSKFSFKIQHHDGSYSSLAHFRCSGVRICTAAGSTAAMHSAGGFAMPILSQDLQYMVREPITLRNSGSPPKHDVIGKDQAIEILWFTRQGSIFLDGAHVQYNVNDGDAVHVSSNAPCLQVFLPNKVHSEGSGQRVSASS